MVFIIEVALLFMVYMSCLLVFKGVNYLLVFAEQGETEVLRTVSKSLLIWMSGVCLAAIWVVTTFYIM